MHYPETILCYGDSNTYGYDPREVFGGRYEQCWCDRLAELTGSRVINLGENGRTVPRVSWQLQELEQALAANPGAALIVMLGTNDILQGWPAQTVCRRTEAVLRAGHGRQSLLLSPPDIPGMAELSRLYGELADKLGAGFLDLGSCGLQLSFDGIHLTQNDHIILAHRIRDLLLLSRKD